MFIVVITMIIIFLLGFKFIDKIYSIAIPSEKAKSSTDFIQFENALIYGNKPDRKELSNFFKNKNINCIFLEEIYNLDMSISYSYLIAAGKSDLDNLMICTICSKMMGTKKIIALCNCSYNKKIYEDNHIPYLFNNDISVVFLASCLFTSFNGR
ncbi:MAG: hypothetical protein PHS04_11440 [Tissierellia bacterium]|nr:hypothetical protein [Tissierellia bacterium]MDD4438632.1 hypothetical protein [Tissierellia bacterium]